MSQNDQMKKIVGRFAHQLSDQDLCFISRDDSLNYVQKIITSMKPEAARTATQEPCYLNNTFNFEKELRDVPVEMVQILENMLQFNPYMRHSANECL